MLKWDLRSLFIVLGILIPHFMTIDKLHYIWPVDRQKYWHKVPRFSWSNYVGTVARKEWFNATTALISNFPKSLLPHFSHISATFSLILPLFMPLSFHFSSQKTGGKSCSKSGFFFVQNLGAKNTWPLIDVNRPVWVYCWWKCFFWK